ncbi:MAG TPA: ferrochelatase [Rhodothermales bacterium]|nr:ferrochelatase [Rhodothermales bacterium]
MTPRQFLKKYRYDKRLISGRFFPSAPLALEPGDRVGVVVLNLGGPDKVDDVRPFLYNLFMDPAIIDFPFGGGLRHALSNYIAKTRSKKVGHDYEVIGGGSPINRLTEEQARRLEHVLNEKYGADAGVTFKTYIAMRYWHPFSEEAAVQMEADGITKVVLLPLYPHYSKTTTGSSLQYWWVLTEEKEIPAWPTTYVFEYAANPKYVRAVSERIDEALQRFPKHVRPDVHLVFSAHGTPVKEMKERRDPYCCLVHSTVEQVMNLRGNDRPFHVSFQSKVGPAEWLTPSTLDKLRDLGEQGVSAVCVIPIAFVTDHIETAYELDVLVRAEAEHNGIEHFEVTSGLNCHPLFIEALAEAVAAQVTLGGEPTGWRAEGDGAPYSAEYPLRPLDQMPRISTADRSCRCHQCERITEARQWTDTHSDPVPSEPHTGSEGQST